LRAIYKICDASSWRDAERLGIFAGSADDKRDGFIHFSTAEQLGETLRRHFAGQEDLLLIKVDAGRFGDALKWEPSRGGALFPHLYGDFHTSTAAVITALPLRADGTHDLPDLTP